MMEPEKRKRGRPRKNPQFTQAELRAKEARLRQLDVEGEKARRDKAQRGVRRIVSEVLDETPWFPKVVAALFMESAGRVAGANPDMESAELGELLSKEFTRALTGCASFEGMMRSRMLPGIKGHVGDFVAAAAIPVTSGFIETLSDFPDEDDDLPPMSDQEAAELGFLPE